MTKKTTKPRQPSRSDKPKTQNGQQPAARPTPSTTTQPATPLVNTRQRFIAALVLFAVVGVAAFLFLSTGLASAANPTAPIMPLDDAYIHFQYAHALAMGQSYRYNPGQPPTSGATSLLYPPLLAVGDLLGFQGERLSWWALAIGILTWLGSTWLVYQISVSNGGPYAHWIGLAIAAAFALHGAVGFAFMSGMETGLIMFFALLTFWHVVRGDLRTAMIAGALAALTRPEGAVIGILAAIYMGIQLAARQPNPQAKVQVILGNVSRLALPFFAALVQPALNLIQTGSITATGMQAKSYLYNVPPDFGQMLRDVAANVVRIWQEMITGTSAVDGEYRTTVLALAALLTLTFGVLNARRLKRLNSAVLVLGWLIGLTLIIALLETAFWQFKRYQMPMIALMFPLAAWPAAALTRSGGGRTSAGGRSFNLALLIVIGGTALLLTDSVRMLDKFVRDYGENVGEVAHSQMAMAAYVRDNLPTDAIVAVHDIGVMRYFGGHTTYDVIGLTTPDAARAWRNGPGSTFEQMYRSPYRPTYMAIYDDARGLTYFQGTSLFRDKLAEFPSTKPTHNVASATSSGQAVYKIDWLAVNGIPMQIQPSDGMTLKDYVNVADLSNEDAHKYQLWQTITRAGFPTEVREMNYAACALNVEKLCLALDGGRLITGGESMTIQTTPGQDMLMITRVHPGNAATLSIFVDNHFVGTRLIPAIPGEWLEIPTLIPASLIPGYTAEVRVEANITDPTQGFYMPYYHWFFQGAFPVNATPTLPGPAATFGGAVELTGRRLSYDVAARKVTLETEWQLKAEAAFDAEVFVHVYTPDGKLIETPGAQIDRRPGDGGLPPANWLPGLRSETYTLALPPDLPAGKYQVAIGMYDPVTLKRLHAEGEGVGSEDRLFVGEIEIK